MGIVEPGMEAMLDVFVHETDTMLEELDEVLIVSEKAHNIDDDNMEQITIDYSIKNIPVLLFFKNGILIKKEIGVVNANNIYNIINRRSTVPLN